MQSESSDGIERIDQEPPGPPAIARDVLEKRSHGPAATIPSISILNRAFYDETGRGATAVLLTAAALTAVIAWPVVRHPSSWTVGNEIAGRYRDPFVVMQQYAAGSVPPPHLQPATDLPGIALARAVGGVAAYNALALLSFPLAALTAYLLAWKLTRSQLASSVAATRDDVVLEVREPPSAVFVSGASGFHAREFDGARTWRWMPGEAQWLVTNPSPRPIAVVLEIKGEAAGGPRDLEVWLTGARAAATRVEGNGWYGLGPLAFPAGETALTFRVPQGDAPADTIYRNGDPRPIAIRVDDWRWAAAASEGPR